MQAFHRAQLPPTGVSHALSVRLTPPQDAATIDGVVVSHLITARASALQVWEVREYEQGTQTTKAALHHLLTRRLHGTVTSLSRVRTLASKLDGADRVLISFKDAKLSLLEWSPSAHDLLPVSLHTFEKLPQVVEGKTHAATDPASRVSVLLLPSNTGGDGTLAVLPFFQEELDLESLGVDAQAWGADGVASIPYAPSHLLPLASLTASLNASGPARSSTLTNALVSASGPPPIRNVIDMVFLPGFNEPTLAILYAPELTWNARLENFSNNCLVSLVTLASDSAKAGTSETTTAVVIATSPSLPHSCLSVCPCPPDLGGTLILTANGVLHLEQGGKLVGVAANGWFGKEWNGPGAATSNETTVRQNMEGAKVVFVANNKASIFCKSGTILELTLQTSGRSVSSMKLQKVGEGVAAACVERIRGSKGRFGEQGYVFVGSEVGESTLLRWEMGSSVEASSAAAVMPSAAQNDAMEPDDEDDIYGVSETTTTSLVTPASSAARTLQMKTNDVIETYGAIRSMAVGLIDDESNPELVAATGGGLTAGLTVFHRTVSPRKRRRIDLNGTATNGLWSIPTNAALNALVASDGDETKIYVRDEHRVDLQASKNGATVAVAGVLCGTSVLRVTPTQVQLLDSNLDVLQMLPLDQTAPATHSVISDPYVAVYGEKATVELFYVDAISGLLAPHIIPAENTKALSLFVDSSNYIPLVHPAPDKEQSSATSQIRDKQIADDDEEDDLYATAPRRPLASETLGNLSLVIQPALELGAMPQTDGEGLAWQWLPVIDDQGALQIFLLPSMQLVFSSSSATLLPEVIEDGRDDEVPEYVDQDDIRVDRVVCVNVGQTRLRPHLLIYLKNGLLGVYEAFPSISAASRSGREASLGVRFVKTASRRLPVPIVRKGKRATEADDLAPPKRNFVPFSKLGAYTGVFSTGEDPVWVLASDHGPAQILEHADKSVYGFTASPEDDTYTIQTKEGAYFASLPSDVCFDREVPHTRIPKDRRYASVSFDIDSGLYVAGAMHDTVFMNFDDEGQPVFNNDSPELTEPHNYRSTVELITPGSWEAIDGYEFRPNEFISTLRTVSLATKSTATGRKDYIAVGTTVYRAEDLAARGGIYLFEVIKTVPDPEQPQRTHRLKLMTFEDTKSVVGNICDINGHIVMSMGQKLYARAFEQDEVLLAVGFLDVGVHVTSLTSVKNFLLIGDALQSVTLVAFQEEPFRLVLLGRDYRPSRVSSANFLIDNGKVAFVVGDFTGVLRMLEYDPSNIASHAGQKLLCRTEYYAGAEAETSLLYARRTGNEDVKQNGILYGGIDGSLYSLVPVRDIVFKRLQLLQSAMMRHVLHFAGLNPRGHRIVKNDTVSRALTKGILDGELLAEFEWLPLDRQVELCESLGTDADTVSANIRNLTGLW